MKLNQKGFTAFEIVVMVVALMAIGTAGYFAYQARQSQSTDYSVNVPHKQSTLKATPIPASPAAAPDPYAGWKTFTSTQEGLSFKYPNDWTLTNINSGIKLVSPHYLTVTEKQRQLYYELYYTDTDSTQGYVGGKVIAVASLAIKNSATKYFLNTFSYNGGASSDYVSGIFLTDQQPAEKSGNAYLNFSSKSNASVKRSMEASLLPPHAQNNGGESLASYQNHPDYNTVIQIFQSLSY